MRVNGWMISNMDMEKNHGQMVQSMKVNTSQERNTEEVFIAGTMDPSIMAIGKKIKSKVSVHTPGQMEDNTKVNGSTTTWTALVFTHGKTEDNTVVNTKMTRNTAMESTPGQMDVHTLDIGAAVSNMDQEPTACQANQRSVVSGKKASVLSGLMRSSKRKLKPINSTTKCTLEKQKVALMLTHLHPLTYLKDLIRESSQLLISSNTESMESQLCNI